MKRRRAAALTMTLGLLSAVFSMNLLAASSSLFADANAKYRQSDFKGAFETYQKIVQTGRGSSAVYYNLGNTALRLGQKGEALVFYERALKISPRDKDLRWNIQVLKNALTDRIEDNGSNPLYTPVQNVLDQVTLHEALLLLGVSLALIAFLSWMGYLFPVLSSTARAFRTIAVFLMIVCAALSSLKWMDTKDPEAVILDKETTAYYGPSEKETKAFVLHEGAQGKILDRSNDWVYIALRNKNTGWIRKNSCEII